MHDRTLPGSPDIVLPKWGVAILVNGCFWHGHKGCRLATRPKSNVEFWEVKIVRNRHRDEVTTAHLEALGWHVITVWECELKPAELEARLDEMAEEVRRAGEARLAAREQARKSRAAAKQEREEIMRRQAALEAEVNALYPIPARIKKESINE